MKSIHYLTTSFAEIRRQPIRSVLTISVVIISTTLFVTLAALGIEGRNALVSQLEQGNFDRTIIASNSSASTGLFSSTVKVAASADTTLTDASVAKIRSLPRVANAYPQYPVWDLRTFRIGDDTREFVASAIGGSAPSTQLAAGTWFDDTSTEPIVVLGNGYARSLGVSPEQLIGRSITITTSEGYRGIGAQIPGITAAKSVQEQFGHTTSHLTARIVGVTTSSVRDNQFYIPMAWARQIVTARYASPSGERSEDRLEKTGYGNIVITAVDSASVKPLVAQIESLGYGTSSYQRQIDQLNQISIVLWILLGSVALISLVSAMLGIVNILLVAINEQRGTIKIWRACGASRSMITRLYMMQAVWIGVVGSIIGGMLGWYISHAIAAKLSATLTAQGLDNLTLPAASWQLVAATIFATILLTSLVSVYPARRASRRIAD